MAYALSTQLPGLSLTARIGGLVQRFKEANARRVAYQKAYSELQGLSNRELMEFGMHRGDLEEIARREAYGE